MNLKIFNNSKTQSILYILITGIFILTAVNGVIRNYSLKRAINSYRETVEEQQVQITLLRDATLARDLIRLKFETLQINMKKECNQYG